VAATKSSCDEVASLLTLGLEVVLWDLSEARSGDGKQPLKHGCDAASASARDGCIFGFLEIGLGRPLQISKH